MKTLTAAPSRPWAAALALGAMLAPALGFAQDTPVPDKGDTAWMMTSTVLVILMTIPGLALFYAGMVRSKNVLSLLMQVFMTFCLISHPVGDLRLQPRLHQRQRLHRRFRPAVPAGPDDELGGGDVQQGRLHPRVHLVHLPAHVRGHHALPDRRRVRRTHQVQRGAAVRGDLVHLRVPADGAHGLVVGGSGRLHRRRCRRGCRGNRRLPVPEGRARLRRRHRRPHQRRHRGARRRADDRQAHRLRHERHASAQRADGDDRRLAAVGGLVRLQRGLGPGSERLHQHGVRQHDPRHRRGGARLVLR